MVNLSFSFRFQPPIHSGSDMHLKESFTPISTGMYFISFHAFMSKQKSVEHAVNKAGAMTN